MNNAAVGTRARVIGLLLLSVMTVLSCDDKKVGGPPVQITPTLTATPAGPVTLTAVGQTVTIVAITSGLTNPVVTFTSSVPSSATVNATTGVVTAVATGTSTITVRATGTDNLGASQTLQTAVQIIVSTPVTPGPVTIEVVRITQVGSGAVVQPSAVSGNVNVEYKLTGLDPTTVYNGSVTLGNGPATVCNSIVSGNMVCPVNTRSLAPAGTPWNLNGPATLTARALTNAGSQAASIATNLTLTNQSGFTPRVGNLAPSGSLWSAGDVTVALDPVIFNSGGVANTRASITVAPVTGAGTITLNQSSPIASPFNFTINPSASPGAEGTFRFTPRFFDGSGNDISNTFDITPFDVNFDLLPPRVSLNTFPSSLPLSETGLLLGHQTGTLYPAGTFIPVPRVSGGFRYPAHPPNCDAEHWHGSITIARDGGPGSDGPFDDPEFTTGDPCGHGKIVTRQNTFFDFTASGTITEPNFFGGQAQLFNGINGCDLGAVVDDVIFPTGTGPGQSPNPTQTFTQAGAFSAPFRLNVGPSSVNTNVCVRITVDDKAVNAAGAKPNTVTRVLSTRVTAN